MTPLRHENLVRLFGGVWNEGADKLCIVLEYAEGGSLRGFMDGSIKTKTWATLRSQWALGVAKCFKYLHHDLNEPVIHRDLKPDNILLTAELATNVADFGESRAFDTRLAKKGGAEDLTMTVRGTVLYSKY